MRIFDQKNATPFSSFCKKTQVKTVCLLKQYAARCCADHKRILPILGGQQFDEKDYPLILNKINTKKCFLVFKGKAVTLASFLTKITGDRAKKGTPFPRFLKKMRSQKCLMIFPAWQKFRRSIFDTFDFWAPVRKNVFDELLTKSSKPTEIAVDCLRSIFSAYF